MSDLKQLLDATRTIESILEKDFGSEGRGMHEKLTSAQWPIPEYLVKKIRYIASVRNKTVHEAGYEVPDLEGFVLECQLAIRKLQELVKERHSPSQAQVAKGASTAAASTATPIPGKRPAAARAQTDSDRGRQRMLWLGAIGAIGTIGALALGGYHLLSRKDVADEHAASPIHAPQAVSAPQASASATAPAADPSTPATPRKASNSSANPAPKAKTKTTNTGTHASTHAPDQSTAPVALLQPSLRFAPGTFGDTEARISFKVRNQLQRTISSLQLDARLFIDGEATPLIDTTRPGGRTSRSGQLFVHLGERGLRAGEERTITVRQGRMDEALWRSPDVLNAQSHRNWSAPDMLNARSRSVQLAVLNYTDGRNQHITVQRGPQLRWQ